MHQVSLYTPEQQPEEATYFTEELIERRISAMRNVIAVTTAKRRGLRRLQAEPAIARS